MTTHGMRVALQLRSWFEAVGIAARIETVGKAKLIVDGAMGCGVELACEDTDQQETTTVKRIRTADFTGRDIARALEAFGQITESLGYGRLCPVNRGAIPRGNVRFTDEFELVAMRHKEFRRAPNPSASELARYRPLVKRTCGAFFWRNRALCAVAGLELDDLVTYGLIYATTFIALYERPDLPEDDNRRLFVTYAKQKLSNFADVLRRKLRSCRVSYGSEELESFGDAYAPAA